MRENILKETQDTPDFNTNISEELRRAIHQLRTNKNIIIREADKGSCIVLLNTKDYIKEGYQHLEDTTTYKPLPEDRTPQLCALANEALERHIKLGAWSRNLEANFVHSTQPGEDPGNVFPEESTQGPSPDSPHRFLLIRPHREAIRFPMQDPISAPRQHPLPGAKFTTSGAKLGSTKL